MGERILKGTGDREVNGRAKKGLHKRENKPEKMLSIAVLGLLILSASGAFLLQSPPGNGTAPASSSPGMAMAEQSKGTTHDPIHITSNSDFAVQASANGWPGDGTQGNPYIIDGYEINANGGTYCIWIENTDVWFVIRNCKLRYATDNSAEPRGSGIYLYTVQHGTLQNNTCSQNNNGIYLYGDYSAGSSNNTIMNNNCSGNGDGIVLVSYSSYNNITNNTCSGNSFGIYLESYSSNNTIMNNNCSGNSYGIYLWASIYNTITNNNCSGNSWYGIYLESYSSNNNITNNNCSTNSYAGIYLYDSTYNNITYNTCSMTSGWSGTGIYLFSSSNNNNITNNNCSMNSYYGIYVDSSSKNTITYNNLYYNTYYGIYISGLSPGHTIHHNNFWRNNGVTKGIIGNCQANDSSGGNTWYDNALQQGNYWSNWNGQGWGTPNAYPIDGSGGAYDMYPLSQPAAPTAPSAPQNLVAIAGNQQVLLSWQAPASDGGSPITNYKIYRNGTLLATIGTNTSYVDYNVVNGVTYTYKVSAVNSVGEGPFSNEVSATPQSGPTVPSAPQNLVANAGNQRVLLSWQAPVSDGGSPITGYKVYWGTSSGSYTNVQNVGNVLTYTVTGLTNGQRYYFAVTALNSVGESAKSNEVSAVPSLHPVHDPIHITSNSDFAAQASANGWPGDGTQGNPYIIDGYEINANGGTYCIWIENTDVWFVIRNCKLRYATDNSAEPRGSGIYLYTVQHGTLQNNTCSQNNNGIYLYGDYSAGSSNNTIMNNNCSGNGDGIVLVSYSSYNNITNNTCSGNSFGIYLESYSSNNTIMNNNCSGNSYGIYLWASIYNTITNNNCSGNSWYGIYLESYSSNNNITNNNCSTNSYAGIYLYDSTYNNITYNTCSMTSGWSGTGIYLFSSSNNNNITNNNCSMNSYYGIYVDSSSKNTITYNNLYYNTYYGIYISGLSPGHTIHHNNFWRNNGVTKGIIGNCQANDSSGGNTWYDNTLQQGNYWSNWNGQGWGTPNAYPIEGSGGAYDMYPLSQPAAPTAPSAPQNLVAIAGNQQVLLSWQAPASDGGSPITNYKIYRNGTLLATIGTNTSYVDYNVVNGVTYTYKVSAVNSVGEGPFSNEVSATPCSAPSAPQNLVATAGNQQVLLSWQAPADNGGSPITNYKIYRNGTLLATIGTNTSYVDYNVVNGVTYTYKVSAVNSVGEGPFSNEVSATPCSAPSAPQNLVATAGNQQVLLSWQAPADNGGSPITGYKVYWGTSSGSYTNVQNTGNVLTYTVTGLTNGQRYYFAVTAINSVGESAKSNEVSAMPQSGPTVPSAPQNLVATAGNQRVALSWQAPANDGGSPITNYKIYRNGTLLATIGTNTSYEDYNVVNGVTYTYKVSAVNSVGEGPFSNEVSATPQAGAITVPSAPQNLAANAGNQQVSLTWQPPADNGGSPITGYKIYYGTSPGNYTITIMAGNVTSYTITGLTNGQKYYFVVSAINGVGEGPKSNEISATPQSGAVVPSAPQNLQAIPGNGNVTLSWQPPADNGGSPIIGYKIYYGTSSGNYTTNITVGNISSYTITGLTNGQKYYFAVSAINGVGEGPRSNEVSATPTGEQQQPPGKTPGFDVFVGICAIAVSMAAIAIWRRKSR